MKKKINIEELRIRAARAQNRYQEALEKQTNEKTLPELRKIVGKCYKYSNSYGGNHERWPLYVKILSIDEDTLTYHTVEFQRTSLDVIEIKLSVKYNYHGARGMEGNGYDLITTSEYNRAKKALKKFVEEKLDL